jgi:riboflavin biosynthesis pyrimidine reductase
MTTETTPERADSEAVELPTAEAVADLARELYGGVPRGGGVIHPTAVWHPGEAGDAGEAADVPYRVLKIREATPKCHHDAFALSFCRARADAIVTTGKNLREEPALTHDYLGSAATRQGLAAWRRQQRKASPPLNLILTSGRGLDFDHPFFDGPGKTVLFTGEKVAAKVKSAAVARGVRVVEDPFPDVRRAVAWLQRQGCGTLSIEAGPSTSTQLYKPPRMVDEVLLSVYEGSLAPEIRGGEFLAPEALGRAFLHRSSGCPVRTQDGLWNLYRYF